METGELSPPSQARLGAPWGWGLGVGKQRLGGGVTREEPELQPALPLAPDPRAEAAPKRASHAGDEGERSGADVSV